MGITLEIAEYNVICLHRFAGEQFSVKSEIIYFETDIPSNALRPTESI